MDTQSATTTNKFPFLELPPELRNRTYQLVIPSGEKYKLFGDVAPDAWVPAISRTCQQLRAETLATWRSANHFILSLDAHPRSSFDPTQIAESCIEEIQRLTITQSMILPLRPRGLIDHRSLCRINICVVDKRYYVEVIDTPRFHPSRVITHEKSKWYEAEHDPDLRDQLKARIQDMVEMAEVILKRPLIKITPAGW